jgi:putative endopeptidase
MSLAQPRFLAATPARLPVLPRNRCGAALMLAALVLGAPAATLKAAVVAPSQSGLRLDHMDRTVSPGADFYRFANGTWHEGYRFRPDETYAGARPDLIALRKARIRAIVEDAARAPGEEPGATAVGVLYTSFLNEQAIEAAGLFPARADLARIRAMQSTGDLLDLFADAPAQGLPSAIGASIFYDFDTPGRLRYRLAPAGTGLPRREIYLDQGETAVRLRAAYVGYLTDMLHLAGERDAGAKARDVLALETRLAELSWATRDARDPLKTANVRSVADLKAAAPGIDWDRFFRRAGVAGIDRVILAQPDAMPRLTQVIAETPIATWRAWAVAQYLGLNAPYLSSPFADRQFAFFDRDLAGQQQPAPRWQRGIELVEGYFGDALGQLYVERHFPEENRRIVAGMFDRIRHIMRQQIASAAWMSEPTRTEALQKIDTLNVKIGYPSAWPGYGNLQLSGNDLFGNLKQARARAWQDRAALVHGPLPKDRWMTPAQTSGAAANPNLNEITIPAGALEPPYFSPGADPAVNYGAIGAIMGHELSHLFDQLGRRMDATGKLRDWWAPEDAQRYEAIANRVVKQYDGIVLGPGLKVDGRLTQNENIADVAGLGLAHQAWRQAAGKSHGRKVDGFTGDQLFFLSWAQMRAGKMTESALRNQLASGPHAPDEVRGTQPMRNIDAWYDAFGIKPGDPLYIPPDRRAAFW